MSCPGNSAGHSLSPWKIAKLRPRENPRFFRFFEATAIFLVSVRFAVILAQLWALWRLFGGSERLLSEQSAIDEGNIATR